MQNLQNIPGETDLDIPLPDDNSTGDEKDGKSSDLPLPPDKLPQAPVEEPGVNQSPINENPVEPERIMSRF